MSVYDIVIAGAGSVGLSLSYYCAKVGMKVLVLDGEASWGRGQNRAAIGGIRASFSDPAKIRICTESLAIVSRFKEEHGINVEWRKGGYLFVAYDEERERAFRELLALQRAAGLEIDWIGPEKVAELAPGIRAEGLRGGSGVMTVCRASNRQTIGGLGSFKTKGKRTIGAREDTLHVCSLQTNVRLSG